MNTRGQDPKQKRIRQDALIEALRGVGGDVFTQTGLQPKTTPETSLPPESLYFEEREELLRRARRQETVRHEEKLVFTAKERERKAQVASLVEEVKKLAGAVQNLSEQVQTTAFQAPVEPGIYHVNFFQKVISFLRSLTQKVEDGTHWLAQTNAKAKKRNFYWGQVQKSGTKFMLSQERYMATQVG